MKERLQTFDRSRLLHTGASAFAAIAIVRSSAEAAQFSYKLACLDPPETPAVVRLVQMSNAVEAETNGRLKITVFPNAILGSQSSQLGQLRLGSIQLLSSNHSSYSAVVPAAQISSLGFAFTSWRQPIDAMDGPLGAYIRQEFALKGMYVLGRTMLTGFRQMTSSIKPIRTADDFAGLKLRVLPAPIFVDLFRALGAAPTPIDANEMYTALQTHLVDGQENAFSAIESYRLFEVQRYLSITNHIWSGTWVVANTEAWNALPPDIQGAVKRNAVKYTALEQNDSLRLNDSLADKLKRQGLAFNVASVAGVRARLGSYYARWKNEFGSTGWGLLEAAVGALG